MKDKMESRAERLGIFLCIAKHHAEMDELKEHLENLDEWISRLKHLTEILPYVQEERDQTLLKIKVSNALPTHLNPAIKSEIQSRLIFGIDYWNHLPTITFNGDFDASSGIATSATGSTATLIVLSDLNKHGEFQTWTSPLLSEFEVFEKKYSRQNENEKSLQRFGYQINDLYKQSLTAYSKYVVDISTQIDWGMSCRRILEKFNGSLNTITLELVKKINRTIQKVTWEDYADNLSRGGIGSTEHKALCELGEVYKKLHSEFTNIGKVMITPTPLQASTLMISYNDFIFNVTSLLDESKLQVGSK
jgi:hypothetical protein